MTKQQAMTNVAGSHYRNLWAEHCRSDIYGVAFTPKLWNRIWQHVRQPPTDPLYWNVVRRLKRTIP